MQIPVIRLDRVLHLGTMDRADLGVNYAASHEGDCLSVSLCPHAWEEIAKLGGSDLHELRTEHGLFLDMHAVILDEGMRTSLLEWAAEEGLVADREVWKFWWRDLPYSTRWEFEYRGTMEAAFEAVRRHGGCDFPEDARGPKGRPGIEAVTMSVATRRLQDVSGVRCLPFQPEGVQIDPGCHLDAVLVAWARRAAPEVLGRPLDGVWWREPYSPARLSAPRGGVFPERVGNWTSRVVDIDTVSDRRELKAMPATEAMDAEPAFGPRP